MLGVKKMKQTNCDFEETDGKILLANPFREHEISETKFE